MELTTTTVLLLLAAMAVGYLLGSINFGVIVSRCLYHEDVRSKGSGNAGTTNILRTYGKKAAALTLAGDMGKGAVAVILAHVLIGWVTGSDLNGVYAGYLVPSWPANPWFCLHWRLYFSCLPLPPAL